MQDFLRNYHRNTGTPRCALKVGLMKAYDRVRCDFIRGVLKASGFPEAFVQWIMECFTTTTFSISLMLECLNSFKEMSGLAPNPDKSNILTCGVAPSVKNQLIASLGYREGALPVRYLGVPLISSRLKNPS